MTARQPGPYSPDGKYWWDGAAWRPVPAPPPGAAVPPGFAAPHGYPGPPAGRKSGAGTVWLTIGAAVVALVLGGLIGGVTGLVTVEPKGDDVVPAFTEKFPTAEQQYLPKVTLAAIADRWLKKANSWKCEKSAEPPDHLYSEAKNLMTCTPPGERGYSDMHVDIEYDGEDKIKVVQAKCHLGTYNEVCRSLLSTMADALFAPQPKYRKKAEAWAKQNAGSERVTTIGGIRLETGLSPLELTAMPAP